MNYSNIAIIRLSSLGDIVHTLPAFYLLRKNFPEAKINWLVEPPGAKLLENVPGIDKIVVINLKAPTLQAKLREVKRVVARYRKKFDLVFDFQGLIKSALLAFLLNGHSVGFNRKNLREPAAGIFYKGHADLFDENNHVIYKNIHLVHSLMRSIGLVTGANSGAEYPPLKKTNRSNNLTNFLSEKKLSEKKFLILNVGGGWETKLLNTDQYIAIIEDLMLKIKNEDKIVVLWGNEKERETAEYISQKTGAIMSIFLTFSDLIEFIGLSRSIITADTLALHLADMVGIPSVGIFGPTSPFRNGSLLKHSSAVYENLPCSFCYKKKCGKMDCKKNISTKKIIQAIEKIYEKCN